jgi:hypothetical protein
VSLHPAFKYHKEEEVSDERAIRFYSAALMYKGLMLKESALLEEKIKEIKTTNNRSISVREYNKLNKKLFTINKEIEDIQSRLDACDIYFSNIEQDTIH